MLCTLGIFSRGTCSPRVYPLLITALLLPACSTTQDPKPGTATEAIASLMSARDRARLEALSAERAQRPSEAGYQIGPDDLLDLRIRDLVEAKLGVAAKLGLGAAVADVQPAPAFLQGQRVSATGDVTIPQIGEVRAQGLTPRGLEEAIRRRLVAAGVLHSPEVSVTIVEYRSAVVAVVGSVQRPGLYPLTRPGATVADLIWAAGGPTRDAGRLVQFSPVQPGQERAGQPRHRDALSGVPAPDARARQVASVVARDGSTVMNDVGGPGVGSPVVASGPAPEPSGEASLAPAIRIDLEALLTEKGSLHLDPQVRPGDVISISPAGNVLVGGWVFKPGSYAITRSLTLSGAVTAAAGPIFAADQHSATVRRVLAPGEERVFEVDLEAVAEGREFDLVMVDGDVVNLPVDNLKIVPWALWTLINSLLRFGATLPLV